MKSDVEKLAKSWFVSSKSGKNGELSQLNSWQIAVKAIAKSNRWQMFLITVGSASSIIYPHAPLVGFAAVTGNTLTRKKL